VTLVGGFLAGSGQLNYWLVLSSAILGAVLGVPGCGLVERLAFPARLGRFFRVQRRAAGEIKNKFGQNAAKAVFWSLCSATAIFAGLMAGIAEMPYGKFFLCNLAGATVWASVMVTLAFFVGRLSLEQLIAWVAQFTLVAASRPCLDCCTPVVRVSSSQALSAGSRSRGRGRGGRIFFLLPIPAPHLLAVLL